MGISGAEQHTLQTHFGAFLRMRRDQWGVRQREVLLYLPGWTQANYSRLETGTIAPAFDQLLPIYAALQQAGVQWDAHDRQLYLALARTRIEEKKSHTELRSEREWADLRYQLADVEFLLDEPDESPDRWSPPKPLQAETRHLLGRSAWLASITQAIQSRAPKKLVLLQGPVGIGKSSELHRLIQHFIHVTEPAYHVIWIPLLPAERGAGPESSLTLLLGNILAESGAPAPTPEMASWQKQQRLVFAHLEQSPRPVVILVDNAENALMEDGSLSACWEEFLAHFLRRQHRATLVMATKEWPGWPGRDRVLVQESAVPPLDAPTCVQLLQQLGLEQVPIEHLQEVCARVGGIPLCLEWVAALAQDPLLLDNWQDFAVTQQSEADRTQRLIRLLEEPALLRGHIATKLQPLFERVIAQHLSAEARALLNHLAVCNVPLGKTALQALCDRPAIIRELRNNSLLVAYSHRVQVLPMVASVVEQGLENDEVTELEKQVIRALRRWKKEGSVNDSEAGNVISELVMLLIKHRRLLDAAQQLLPYRSLISNSGYALRLAQFTQEVMSKFDWHTTPETECGGLILHYTLAPFLGKNISDRDRVRAYQSVLDAVSSGKVKIRTSIEAYLIGFIMELMIEESRFKENQLLMEVYYARLASLKPTHVETQYYLLEECAWFLGIWSDALEEDSDCSMAQTLRDRAISLYRQYVVFLSENKDLSPLRTNLYKGTLSSCFSELAYYLAKSGHLGEALQMANNGILLKEQGYLRYGTLVSAYREKSEILAKLGRFQEALLFDEKALAEAQRLANMGHTPSQEEVWMCLTNRGRLYLRLGRIDEAERLLSESLLNIHTRRKMCKMLGKEALTEIEQWRCQAKSPHYQLDWRWVARYRELISYDSYWWLTWAGPFTEEEQQQWDYLFSASLEATSREQLSVLMMKSREREIMSALAEQREPGLRYPAIEIDEVRRRIAALLELDKEISQAEPNVIVRRLYHETIEEEIVFLRLIEATYEGNTDRFWECSSQLFPVPTAEEMHEALSGVKQALLQGRNRPETAEVSQRLDEFLRSRLCLTFEPSPCEEEIQEEKQEPSSQPRRTVSAQAAKRFFEAVLQTCDYEGWRVVIDSNATNARVEQGLRQLFLPEQQFSLEKIRHLFIHELLGHVAQGVAGERSPLGLLGIHMKNSQPTEEGVALYHERRLATLYGRAFNNSGIMGTLATGLASGVITPPQTFLSLFTFLELFSLLKRLLKRPGANKQKAQKQAQAYALSICLRTYRGVPDLERAGICYLQDAIHFHGLRMIERAVERDETILDRLAVGVCALEYLPELQELGILSSPQPLRKLAYDPNLDSYILSFEEAGEKNDNHA